MAMTQPATRTVIEDFHKQIEARKLRSEPPGQTVINFRDEASTNTPRTIYKVPLELLRYRKENGRICSSVMSYEREKGLLDDQDPHAQKIIAQFLREKNPDKTKELKQLMRANGQKEPAIITCDGFLIDGNRRRVVLEELRHELPADDRFRYMKVVILPAPQSDGGPPTLEEIEQIENRYQLQRTGKAEYYGFDAALSMREKERRGFRFDAQLRDDPRYRSLGNTEFERLVRKKRKELLRPLACIDRYLDSIGRPGQYAFVSTGIGDPEGRWQAFVDYAVFYENRLMHAGKRNQLGIAEDEVGAIEQAAFKVIRLRDVPGMGKVHSLMRKLPDYCEHAKDDLLELNKNVKDFIEKAEQNDPAGNPLPLQIVDQKWAKKYRQEITYRLKRAEEAVGESKRSVTSLDLLRDAYKKLTHPKLDVTTIPIADLDDAQRLGNELSKVVKELSSSIYRCKKDLARLESR